MDTNTDRTPQVDKKYIMPRYRGTDKDYILYGGLLDAAHKMELAGITTTLVQIPTDQNKNIAIVHATVTMPWGQFSGLGDCDANEPRSMVAKTATIRMAETRAKARALRDAINANEFEVDDDLARVVDQETGEITPTATRRFTDQTTIGTGASTKEVATEKSTTTVPVHPSSPTQGSATRRPAGGPGLYEPGGAAGAASPRPLTAGSPTPTCSAVGPSWSRRASSPGTSPTTPTRHP